MSTYQQLEARFRRLAQLDHINAILDWDEAVMMPPGGSTMRNDALSELSVIRHQVLTQGDVAEEIHQALLEEQDPWRQANLRCMQHDYTRAQCIPADLKAELTRETLSCMQAWRTEREQNDWQNFMPRLQKVVALVREMAQAQGDALGIDPYDALIDGFSPGVSQAMIDPIFQSLKDALPGLLDQILTRQSVRDFQPITGDSPVDQQRALGQTVMSILGFSFDHGRLDVSHHPFCGGVRDDVRITTRYRQEEFISALMAICHETGHGLYERQRPEAWCYQPVGQAMGMTIHESQSLFVEMQLCRSREFIALIAPLLESYFPGHGLSIDEILSQYHHVQSGYIRVDADEVTYPLHVILRYELEQQLIGGAIEVEHLPELWHDKMKNYLGIEVGDNHRDGVMQDIHWPSGGFGYFPAYTLGALFAAQQYTVLARDVPTIMSCVAEGDFAPILSWLERHVHAHGSYYDTPALIEAATGKALSSDDFLAHIKRRYLS